jgi:hypothetical protein
VFNLHGAVGIVQTEEDALERRIARDDSVSDYVLFGVWDSHVAITPLQLQVAVSMALGVRAADDDVHVVADEQSFFEVRVEHATAEECDYIASPNFLVKLNLQLTHYGGSAVLSRPPRLHKPMPSDSSSSTKNGV